MYVTLNYQFLLRRKAKFIHIRPTVYFLTYYTATSAVISATSRQKFPRIARRSLVRLL